MDLDVDADRFALRAACETFLYREAQLLDDRDLIQWHDEFITSDVKYRVPIRTTRERTAESEFSHESFHMKEDWGSLRVRVERMENDFAWSEDPPSRTRRLVSNVRVTDVDGDELSVRSNFVIYRAERDETSPDLLAGERHDTLRREDGDWRLADRTVLLDHTVIPTPSLSIIL